MRTKIIQSADHRHYKPMLHLTGSVNALYAEKYGYDYEQFFGIIRGSKPWHAAYNRIFLLDAHIRNQRYDWVIYLDADCLVTDFDQDLGDTIIRPNAEKAFIFSSGTGGAYDWDVNSGVIFVNCRHHQSTTVINAWRERFARISTDRLDRMRWMQGNADQGLLQKVLKAEADAHGRIGFLKVYTGKQSCLINYSGNGYISQFLRVLGDLSQRMALIEETKHRILNR